MDFFSYYGFYFDDNNAFFDFIEKVFCKQLFSDDNVNNQNANVSNQKVNIGGNQNNQKLVEVEPRLKKVSLEEKKEIKNESKIY